MQSRRWLWALLAVTLYAAVSISADRGWAGPEETAPLSRRMGPLIDRLLAGGDEALSVTEYLRLKWYYDHYLDGQPADEPDRSGGRDWLLRCYVEHVSTETERPGNCSQRTFRQDADGDDGDLEKRSAEWDRETDR